MNTVTLRGICAASVFFGVALCLLPEGREKRVGSLCASAALVLMFLSMVRATGWDAYALSLAEMRSAGDSISIDAAAQRRELDRFVIERECEEYILDKAADFSLAVRSVSVRAVWADEGVWVPQSATIVLSEDGAGRARLSALIEAQLGIAAARQEWSVEEDTGKTQ